MSGYDGRSRYFRFEIKIYLDKPEEILIEEEGLEREETALAA